MSTAPPKIGDRINGNEVKGCNVCSKLFYFDSNPNKDKPNEKPYVKKNLDGTIHVDERSFKKSYKQTVTYQRVNQLGNGNSELAGLSIEFPIETKHDEALAEVKKIVLDFIGIRDVPTSKVTAPDEKKVEPEKPPTKPPVTALGASVALAATINKLTWLHKTETGERKMNAEDATAYAKKSKNPCPELHEAIKDGNGGVVVDGWLYSEDSDHYNRVKN